MLFHENSTQIFKNGHKEEVGSDGSSLIMMVSLTGTLVFSFVIVAVIISCYIGCPFTFIQDATKMWTLTRSSVWQKWLLQWNRTKPKKIHVGTLAAAILDV